MKTLEVLQSALSSLEKLDALDLVETFRKFEHGCSPGTYCALRLNPATGDIRTSNEASWCCSTDEYFNESGILSRQTLISTTRAHWDPSPDDGFEWCDGTGYVHAAGDYSGWITAEAFGDLDADDRAKFTEWFSISDTPVNGWVPDGWSDWQVKVVDSQLEELRGEIAEEISKIECENET